MARKPAPISVSTLKSVAAAHAVGLTYLGPAEGGTLDWAVAADGRFHAVKKRTTGGVARAAHFCRSHRSVLAGQKDAIWWGSRERTQIEIVVCDPGWQCDEDGMFADCPSTDGIMAAAHLELAVEVTP